MRQGLEDLYAALASSCEVGKASAEKGDWATALSAAKASLSAGSRLHAQLSVVVELAADAAWMAEVDRHVRSAPPSAELAGQASIVEAIKEAQPKGRTPRKS